MAFLEEKDKDVVVLNNFDKANAIDYTIRYPKTAGKKLGMLTGKDNTPIQIVSAITANGYVDISNVGDLNLKSFLKGNDYLSGTGTTFAPLKTFAEKGGRFCASTNKTCTNLNNLTIPTNGLISYYPLKNNSNDELGTNNGTTNGDIIFDGKSASFDGNGDYIQIGADTEWSRGDNLSISVWSKCNYDGSDNNSFTIVDNNSMTHGDGDNNNSGMQLFFLVKDSKYYIVSKFVLVNNEDTTDSEGNSSSNYSASAKKEVTKDFFNEKHNLVAVLENGNHMTLYIDGQFAVDVTSSQTINWSNDKTNYSIGIINYDGDLYNEFQGNINNVRHYNRVLTEEEIGIIYNKEK